MGASDITSALKSVPANSRSGAFDFPTIEADSYADIAIDRAVDEFKGDLEFFPEKTGQELIPSILRPASSLSGAFGRLYEHLNGVNQFRETIELFIDSVSTTTEAGDYLSRWNTLIRTFTEKAFVARALLEASLASDTLVFDHAAATELRRMEVIMDGARQAFQERIEGPFRESWAFNFVGMQLERINQPMNMLNHYPRALVNPKNDGEKIKRWRAVAIGELKRLSDPMTHLSGIENYGKSEFNPRTSLEIGVPEGVVDLFTARPRQDTIDFDAVRKNARSFLHLRTALEMIAFESGRGGERKLSIRYSPTMGSLLIKDEDPDFRGALYPFGIEPMGKRLSDLVKRMGPGAELFTKSTSSPAFDLWNNTILLLPTISMIVIQLADELVPDRKMTFEEAQRMQVASKMDLHTDDVVQIDRSGEDSDVHPMASVFAHEEAKPRPTEIVGIVREASQASEGMLRGGEIFAEIAEEVAAEEMAAVETMQSAKTPSAGVLAAAISIPIKT
jgi:hypothetical protein